ncbi:MAG: potassium channel family protein [Candidatus Promineifilaceae bacterium]
MLLPRRKLLLLLVMPVLLILIGTVGYYLIEGWDFLESLYMTAITLTTVGFKEVRPLSRSGQVFTIVFLFLGVGTLAYALNTAGQYFFEVDIGERLRRRRSRRMIERLENHVVVCGYGRVGQSAARILQESETDVVLIERDQQRVESVQTEGLSIVIGDATKDEILKEAGIERAKGLMVCTGSDTENLFIVLSARTMNPDLNIVARSADEENQSKMRRAGADRVISPYQLGGRFMASVLTKPHVTDFLDVVTLDSGLELWLEEVKITEGSPLAGHTVVEADLRRKTGAILVALLRHETGTTMMPDEKTRLLVDDQMFVLGTKDQLQKLGDMAGRSPTN